MRATRASETRLRRGAGESSDDESAAIDLPEALTIHHSPFMGNTISAAGLAKRLTHLAQQAEAKCNEETSIRNCYMQRDAHQRKRIDDLACSLVCIRGDLSLRANHTLFDSSNIGQVRRDCQAERGVHNVSIWLISRDVQQNQRLNSGNALLSNLNSFLCRTIRLTNCAGPFGSQTVFAGRP